MSDFIELFVGLFMLCMAIVVSIILFCFAWTGFISRPACYAIPELYGIESRWNFWEGCAVKTDRGWIPKEQWKGRDIQDRHEITIKQ